MAASKRVRESAEGASSVDARCGPLAALVPQPPARIAAAVGALQRRDAAALAALASSASDVVACSCC